MTDIWEPHAVRTSSPAHLVIAGGLEVHVVADEVITRQVDEGVLEAEVTGKGDVRVEWRIPCTDAIAFWTPDVEASRWLPAAWSAPQEVSLTRGAPVASLVGMGDVSLCTFAAMETSVLAAAGVVEETGEFRFWVQAQESLRVRIDRSRRHFARCLEGVARWWAPWSSVPEAARMPAYSTWYSMHQNVSPAEVEKQAVLGKDLGCDVIIVDDGWMTGDRGRGYGHTGDWEPLSLPDVVEHVRRVHELGVSYLLWFALPFIGRDSSVWERFERYALRRVDHLDAVVVDPRYPEVRDYLTDRLARVVEEWGMDGLKIDFVDWFGVTDPPGAGPEADCTDVAEGVERLLAAIHGRITAVRPEAMVEHRQPYVSHGLWPYTTMIRATDCPLSSAANRQRTIDLRLVSGPLAVHADMLMWHPEERPEQIAVHLVSVLFAVPQISVDLAAQKPEQREVLEFWLGIFRTYSHVLQRATLEPARPDLGYPLVRAYDGHTMVIARYAPLPIEIPASGWGELLLANADADSDVLLTGGPAIEVDAVVKDARGFTVWAGTVGLGRGVAAVTVPTGGLLTLTDRTSTTERTSMADRTSIGKASGA